MSRIEEICKRFDQPPRSRWLTAIGRWAALGFCFAVWLALGLAIEHGLRHPLPDGCTRIALNTPSYTAFVCRQGR